MLFVPESRQLDFHQQLIVYSWSVKSQQTARLLYYISHELILTKYGITGECVCVCLCVSSDQLSVLSTNLRLQFSCFFSILLNVMSPWNNVHFPSSSSQNSSNITTTMDLTVAVNINLLLILKVFSNLSYRSPPISKQLQIRAQSGGRGASHSCQRDIWRTPWGIFFFKFGKTTFWALSQEFILQVQYHLTYKCLIGRNYEVMTFD